MGYRTFGFTFNISISGQCISPDRDKKEWQPSLLAILSELIIINCALSCLRLLHRCSHGFSRLRGLP